MTNELDIDAEKCEILVVDDEPQNIDLMFQILNEKGYRVSAAPSSAIALGIASEIKPDLILLDIMMPGMDGFETCKRLKADPITADIPVILVTGRTDESGILEGFSSGACDYIRKPIRPEELFARVTTQIKLRELLSEKNSKLIMTEKLALFGEMMSNAKLGISRSLELVHSELNAMENQVSQLKRSIQDPSPQVLSIEKHFKVSQQHFKEATELISSFERLASIERNKEYREFSLNRLLEQIVNLVQVKLNDCGFSLKQVCPNDLTLHNYPGYLAQAVLILLSHFTRDVIDDEATTRNLSIVVEEISSFVALTISTQFPGATGEYVSYSTYKGKCTNNSSLFLVEDIIDNKLRGELKLCHDELVINSFCLQLPPNLDI